MGASTKPLFAPAGSLCKKSQLVFHNPQEVKSRCRSKNLCLEWTQTQILFPIGRCILLSLLYNQFCGTDRHFGQKLSPRGDLCLHMWHVSARSRRLYLASFLQISRRGLCAHCASRPRYTRHFSGLFLCPQWGTGLMFLS